MSDYDIVDTTAENIGDFGICGHKPGRSEGLRRKSDWLKQRYADRYVIFDTPPALPFAEVHSLASLMDGLIFVIREGYASLSNVKGALDILKDTPILGSVFNCASIDNFGGYGYYYGYNQYYSDV